MKRKRRDLSAERERIDAKRDAGIITEGEHRRITRAIDHAEYRANGSLYRRNRAHTERRRLAEKLVRQQLIDSLAQEASL